MTSTESRVTRSKRDRDEDAADDALMKKQCLDNEEDGERRASFSSPSINKFSGGKNGLSSGRRQDRPADKPAELFRKDLISAMKLADSEQLQQDDYVTIQDPWRQEWERGVQVPVRPENIPEANLRVLPGNNKLHGAYGFKLNPRKYLHALKDETYQQSIHELHETQKLSEQVCRYDLDELDVTWLEMYNDQRTEMGQAPLEEWLLEKIMEALENQCYSNMQTMIKTVEGLGIEYDENVVCDVCRSPDSEDNNEMVFCDACDICVHQACYGIQKIPEGSWLCRVCALGVRPKCILCPRLGGAMKSTKSGSKWAHVSCALWIPEVSIGCPEKMEPITKISQIPSSRWSLVCSICRERSGACIQCCVKTCKTAFHVTCAFHSGLDMKTILDEDGEDVSLKAYCMKHTRRKDGEATPKKAGDTPTLPPTPKKESEMTEEEKTELRSHRLKKLAEEFYLCVKPLEIATMLKLDEEMVDFVHAYWVLKRRANFDRPLLMPKTEEADLLSKQREDTLIARMKMFIHLRQDLERVRNLCYMVSRREKIRKQVYKMKEQIFHKQVAVIRSDKNFQPRTRENQTVVTAHRATNTLYDNPDGVLNAARLLERREREESDNLSLSEQESVSSKPAGKGQGKLARAGFRARNARLAREQRRKMEQRQQPILLAGTSDYDSMSDSGKTDDSCGVEDINKMVSNNAKPPLRRNSDDEETSSEQMSLAHKRLWQNSDTNEAGKLQKCTELSVQELGQTECRRTTRSTANSVHGGRDTPVDVELDRSLPKGPKSSLSQVTPDNVREDEKSNNEVLIDALPRRSLRSARSGSQEAPSREQPASEEAAAAVQQKSPKSQLPSQRSAFSFIENEISDLRKRKESEKSDEFPALTAEVKPEPVQDKDIPQNKAKVVPALAVKLRDRPKFSLSLSGRRISRDQNGRYPKSTLVVSEEIKHRVQGRLRRRQNGLHHSRRLLNSCFSKSRIPPLSHRDLQLQTVQNVSTLKKVKPEMMLKDALGVSSIQGSFRLGGKPLNSINSATHTLTTDADLPLGIPETRSMRRKIESDLESDVSEKLFEKVDDEVSTRSREATPDQDQVQPAHVPRKGLPVSKLSLGRKLRRTLATAESDSDGENAFVSVINSEDEYVPSDNMSEASGSVARRKSLRKRPAESTADEESRDSFTSFER